jgi:hypothetical protein
MKRSSRGKPTQVVTHMCMEVMLEISLQAIFISNWQKCYVFLIIYYVFSSTKLEKRAEQFLPGSKRRGNGKRGHGGEITQTMYTHMNKCINNRKDFLK